MEPTKTLPWPLSWRSCGNECIAVHRLIWPNFLNRIMWELNVARTKQCTLLFCWGLLKCISFITFLVVRQIWRVIAKLVIQLYYLFYSVSGLPLLFVFQTRLRIAIFSLEFVNIAILKQAYKQTQTLWCYSLFGVFVCTHVLILQQWGTIWVILKMVSRSRNVSERRTSKEVAEGIKK